MNTTPKLVKQYGCTKCQETHYEGDAQFAAHIGFQSKHGVKLEPHWREVNEARESQQRAALVAAGVPVEVL